MGSGGSEGFEFMRVAYGFAILGVVLAVNNCASIQPDTTPGSEMREIEMVWREFWGHILRGDYQAASQYVHSDYGKNLPRYSPREIEERKLVALFMLNCRPEPPVSQLPQGELRFRLRCKQPGESKESVGEQGRLRRDTDGKLKSPGL